MTRSTGRSAALRKADAVMAQRAVAMQAHEEALRAVLAAFFQARDEAEAARVQADAAVERVRRDADARISQIRERAQKQAAGFEQEAQAAVRRMVDLGEDARAVAEATGLTAARVRTARRAAASDPIALRPRGDARVGEGEPPDGR